VKAETYVFVGTAIFFALVAPVYWILSKDPTGTTALVVTFLLCALIGYYLMHTGRHLGDRPEDRKDGEIEDAAGEYGFFSPQSVWPLAVGASVALAVTAVLVGWWLLIIAVALLAMTVAGFVFEYYRGVYEG
jgi:hypothetical protein